jgi:hypothetical protein
MQETTFEMTSLPWSIPGNEDRPTITNTCGLDAILWLFHFLEINKLLIMPLVDNHVSKNMREQLFEIATLQQTGTVEKKDHRNILEWEDQGGLFKECSEDLRSGEPHTSRMKCYKGMAVNVHRTHVRQKIMNFSWKELSGKTLNVYSSTIDWLQLVEMSLGYWYSTVQECNVCKKTVREA